MGFFSLKETYVASSIFNLAGDINERPKFLKSLVLGGVYKTDKPNLSNTLRQGYMAGPGMKIRNFFHWAENNYQAIGIPEGNLGAQIRVNADVVAREIPAPTGKKIVIQYVDVGLFDHSYWAEQYMFENRPNEVDTAWSADMNAAGEITITFANGSTHSFTPTVQQNATYIYAIYNEVNIQTNTWAAPKMFIYRIGSGNLALDEIVTRTRSQGEFVPSIPLRLNNKWVKDVNPSAAVLAKKAFKKALGGDIQQVIDKLAENEDLDEIDYAYVMFGVPLNTKERAGREYLFRFFDKCRRLQLRGTSDFAAWDTANSQFDGQVQSWETKVKAANGVISKVLEKERGKQPMPFGNNVRIKSNGSLNTNIDISIEWSSITETKGTGKKTSTAKAGDVWFTYGAGMSEVKQMPLYQGTNAFTMVALQAIGDKTPIHLHWQVTDNSWRTLTILGMKHKNLIYKNKSVRISALEALQDSEESGFLVPLHYATLREMGMVETTQMMTTGAYIVINSYKVVKKKWYQTGFFKVFLFVAIIVITVVTAGTGTAPALAAATSIAAAVGLTGIAALIVGAIINTIVQMIVAKILMALSVEIFGAKWGALIGAILTVATFYAGGAAIGGQSFATALNSLSSVPAIIQMTSALGNGIAGFVAGETMETVRKTQELMQQSKADQARIQELWEQNLGNPGVRLDPMSLTSDRFDPMAYVQEFKPFIPESSETFLSRTLLTGSDIAEMTMDTVTEFVAYSTRVDLPR